ncbi:MAG: hypothetical protein QF682_09310 [Candidatus Thermoplasmatota archaeon]|nr:hypothetical protein [Candidatus Thermoplasmatota archaeon]
MGTSRGLRCDEVAPVSTLAEGADALHRNGVGTRVKREQVLFRKKR